MADTTLKWHEVTIFDMATAMTLERQIKAICAFGGIHDFEFAKEIDDPCVGTISDIWDTDE